MTQSGKKGVRSTNGAVLLELLDSFINVNSLLVKALYSSFARYIYISNVGTFSKNQILYHLHFVVLLKL